MTMDKTRIRNAILKHIAQADTHVNKQNLLGLESYPGDLERRLGLSFEKGERQVASLIFKELVDEGFVAPSYTDTMNPEGWFELTAQGQKRLKGDVRVSKGVFKTTFGRYSEVRKIGEGGCGFVVEVADKDDNRFALKQLKVHATNTSKRMRFKNELEFCLKSDHPNIVKVHDHGFVTVEEVDCPFYLMPLCDSTLRSLMKTGISPCDVLPIFSQMLDGVEAAHLMKVIHRDLKPENILWDSNSEVCLVADFGIAHFEKEMLATVVKTKNSDRMANYRYSAPEQRDGKNDVDHRADIFALGLILNEMFTNEVVQGLGHRTIESVSGNHAYLDKIVEVMIQQDPVKRFASIDEVKTAILASEKDHVSRQKLNELGSKVIPSYEVDDELVRNPIKIVGADLRANTYVLKIEPHPNMMWERVFSELRGVEFTNSFGPRSIRVNGDELLIEKRMTPVATMKELSKKYVDAANQQYHSQLIARVRKNEADEIERVKMEIQAEKERKKFRDEFWNSDD